MERLVREKRRRKKGGAGGKGGGVLPFSLPADSYIHTIIFPLTVRVG